MHNNPEHETFEWDEAAASSGRLREDRSVVPDDDHVRNTEWRSVPAPSPNSIDRQSRVRRARLRLLILAAIAAAVLGAGLAAIARAPGADYHPPSTSGVRDELRPRAVGDTT